MDDRSSKAFGEASSFFVDTVGLVDDGSWGLPALGQWSIRSAPATIVGSPMGTMSLARYLSSRTAELVIHTLDLAQALDHDLSAPVDAVEESLVFVARRSVRRSPQTVLLALSGRATLPADYSVF